MGFGGWVEVEVEVVTDGGDSIYDIFDSVFSFLVLKRACSGVHAVAII